MCQRSVRAAFLSPFLDQSLFGPLVALFSADVFVDFGAIHAVKREPDTVEILSVGIYWDRSSHHAPRKYGELEPFECGIEDKAPRNLFLDGNP